MTRSAKWIPILISALICFFTNVALLNWISDRQNDYDIKPLPDAANQWVGNPDTLLTSVDIVTIAWCLVGVIFWFCNGRKLQHALELFTVEIILTTFGTCLHLPTVIADPLEKCTEINNIPSELNLLRIGRYCGTGMWSFNIMHVALFYRVMVRSLQESRLKTLFKLLGFFYIIIVSLIIVYTKYSYSASIVLTLFVTFVLSTHTLPARAARHMFSRHIADGSIQEVTPLNNSI